MTHRDNSLVVLPLLLVIALSPGCSDDTTPAQDMGADNAMPREGGVPLDSGTDLPPPADGGATDDVLLPLVALRDVVEGHFTTSPRCAICHQNGPQVQAMRDEKKRPIAPYDLWQATPMANAARDPIWRATVAVQVENNPAQKEAIEAKCLLCHSPMAYVEAEKQQEKQIDMALLTTDDNRAQLALDGVSCALCHQIAPDLLGTEASFSGQFVIGDDKKTYGPHTELFSSPMVGASGGFEPITGTHLRQANLCATCHTLHTQALNADGSAASATPFPEQTPYLEWRNSVFSTEVASPGAQAQTCQGCHLPTTSADGVPLETQVANRPDGSDYPERVVPKRKPYGRHLFVGANTLLPKLLSRFSDELAPNATQAALDAYIAEVRRLLSERTATLSIGQAKREGEKLELEVTVNNLAGHKLPTAYPSRRVVLTLTVKGADGTPLWISGRFDSRGLLVTDDGEAQAFERVGGPYEPHRREIDDPSQVQIYQTILADKAGKHTFFLLRAVGYVKDNRVLPLGFDTAAPGAKAVAPQGVDGDTNFKAGEDTVRYRILLPSLSKGPLTIEAALWHQPLSPRFANELFVSRTPEAQALRRMIAAVGLVPEKIAEADITVP